MAQKRSRQQNKDSEQTPAAEAVIDGRLSGTGLRDRLRQISPVTAGLVCAVIAALGLSVWPYMAPLLIAQSDDPWKTSVNQELTELRSGLGAVTDRQEELLRQLDSFQARLGELDSKMAGVVQSVSQSVDTVNAAIDRFDQQMAVIDEKLAGQPARPDETLSAPAGPAADDSVSEGPGPAQTSGDGRFLPELSLPEASGWWQGLSGWISGLVSVDRIESEQDPQ